MDRSGESFSLRVRLAAWLLMLVFSVAAAEVALRLYLNLFPPLDHRLIDPRRAQLNIFHPSAGPVFYGVRPNFEQRFVRRDFQVHVRTNSRGFREESEHDGGRLSVAFVGDSFAFGWGVEIDQRFSDRIREKLPDRRMLNLAYPNGHAPAYYLAYLNAHPELVPEVLVVMLFAWNDLGSDLEDAVLEPDQQGRLVRVDSRSVRVSDQGFMYTRNEPPPARRSWTERAGRFALGRFVRVGYLRWKHRGPPPERPGQLSALERGEFDDTALRSLGHLAELDAQVRQAGGRTLVFYVPFANFVGDYPNFCQYREPVCRQMLHENGLGEALASWFSARGIEFIDPVDAFRGLEASGERLYFEYDAHWTPAGHRAAAELIAERLDRMRKWLPAGGGK